MIRAASYLFLIVACSFAADDDLSSLVSRKCPPGGKQSDADCYMVQMNQILAGISNGRSEVDIPVLDPLLFKGQLNLSVSAGSDQYRMNFLEPRFTGFSKAKITKLEMGNPLTVTLKVPRVSMTSPYKNSGRLILIQASGGGAMTNVFDDVTINMKVGYGQTTQGGKNYGTVSDFDLSFAPKKSRMRVDKLDSGNAVALELYNVFLSASSNEILGLMLPQMNRQFAAIFQTTTSRILQKLPLDSIFE